MAQREIKFRAWDEGNKVMHTEVQFITSGDDGNDWLVFTSKEQPCKTTNNSVIFDDPYFRQQIHLMQFTGLSDKNGKEIYEGDANDVGYVEYIDGAFWFTLFKSDECFLLREVNGLHEFNKNIYENPELLK